MYTSIQKHYRGFFFQRDYEDRELFNDDMKFHAEGPNEICWAFLLTESGEKVAEYRRGYSMAEYL